MPETSQTWSVTNDSGYPIQPLNAAGEGVEIHHWDPDCFRIGDIYYAISGDQNPPLIKSKDLKTWQYVGPFLKHDLPEVAIGKDISWANFFPLGDKWMLLCISHPFGCRYYLSDWDAEREQFEPQVHGRMNWRSEAQSVGETRYRDFFAPESLLTPDGRRIMWAWLASLDEALDERSVQSLPRELGLLGDGVLRIRPLRELESLRLDPRTHTDVRLKPLAAVDARTATKCITRLDGHSFEIRIVVKREQAERKRFGFHLFASENQAGFPVLLRPETGTLRVGSTEAPFVVSDLPPGEDLQLRIFIDECLVEVFANDRQAVVGAYMDYRGGTGLNASVFGAPITIEKVDVWRLKAANQGYLEARSSRIWKPASR